MPITERKRDTEYDRFLPLFHKMADPAITEAERDQLREQLLTGHLPLAEHIALRYRDRGQPIDDLRQVARLGLIYAIDRFDPERGDFVVFAVPTIMGEVRRYFRDYAWGVAVPRRLKELNRKIATAVNELVAKHGVSPRPAQIAAHLGLPIEDVYQGLQVGMAYQPGQPGPASATRRPVRAEPAAARCRGRVRTRGQPRNTARRLGATAGTRGGDRADAVLRRAHPEPDRPAGRHFPGARVPVARAQSRRAALLFVDEDEIPAAAAGMAD